MIDRVQGGAVDPSSFYDDIAEYYDLIYTDWEVSMRRQAVAISALLPKNPSETRVLDASAGIGTQSLALASLGFDVVARDISEGAIRRLRREAVERRLQIDAAPCDMRTVGESVEGCFDAVISFDNSVPHLLTDSEIVETLRGMARLLAPDGVILISIRDYTQVDRSPKSVHRYDPRARGSRLYRLSQEWEWYDPIRYRTTMIVETGQGDGWEEVVRTAADYYAISPERLLELMGQAGLVASRAEDANFFQPVLKGVAG